MPNWLGGAARDLWESVVPDLERLGLLKEGDSPLLVSLCLKWQEVVDMTAILVREGYFEMGAKRQVAHTAVGIRARAIADLRPLAAQFGLSPASEANLAAPQVPDDGADPFAAGGGYGS
jgi:P27 family predicted phage terminase small subunit